MEIDKKSDSNESSDDEKEELLQSALIQKLTLEAEANPYQYDKHVELIKVLRSSGDLDQLRSARETMSSIYPLSEDLWLEWFEDELPLAQLSEQREYLVGLFEAAVKDYASVKIWNEYCQFLMNNIDTPADIDRTREIFERAIVVVGLNVTEGSSIWNGYRDFESAILDSYQQLEDSGETVGLSAKVQHQIEKINHIFRRQLSIPLMSMKDTLQAYEDWAPDIIPTETMRAYDKALQKLTLCIEYEEKLQNAVGNKLEEYNEYIKYELKDGDPARIQCLYERAIKDNCLQHELWERYASYLDYKLKIAHISVTVYERAIRNCPWISNLWTRYFRALERNNTSLDVIEEKFEQSLKGGFSDAQSYLDVWLEQCYYYKRKITDWDNDTDGIELLEQSFELAIKYMSKYFGLEGDKEFVLMKELAYIQAKYLKDLKKAQELWDTIVKVKSKDPNTWLEYIQFLKLYGDVPMVRRAFQRAIQISFENPEIICNAFLTFERRYANLIELDDAQQKVDVQLHRAKERKEKEALRDNNPNQKDLKNNRKPKKFDKQNLQDKKNLKNKRKLKQQQHNTKHSEQLSNDEPNIKKGKTSDEKKYTSTQAEVSSSIPTTSTVFKLPSQPVATTPKVTSSDIPMEGENVSHESGKQSSNMTENSGKSHSEIARETCSTSEVTTNMSTEHDGERSQQVAEHVDEQGDAIEKVDDELSVFLSNLLFTVEEVHIQNMFEKCGEIETIRLIKKKMGKSKGFAYLQFKQKYSVEQALLLDREALQGRPVFVSRCVDKKTNPTQFKFPTKLDKCTLYVTNIPFELSSDELSELFGQCGKLKQTRVVTNRSGKSRGFAYIEYETETDASSALIKLDKHVINNRPINVSLSNPPSRKQNKSNDNNTSAGNVRDQQNTGIRVKSKTQISLVPRALQKASHPTKPQDIKPDSSGDKNISTATTTTSQAMSNAEFRKFLTK